MAATQQRCGWDDGIVFLEAGVDEAGRGALCGPVVAAAVILPQKELEWCAVLADSKKLSPKKREMLFHLIQKDAIAVGIGESSATEIDTINILQAALLAMKRAVLNMNVVPHKVLVDGNCSPDLTIPTESVVQGDTKVPCISAASIIAKVYRDRRMEELDQRWPMYGIRKHKGYPTKDHKQLLEQWGVPDIYRRSFAPVAELCKQKD